MKTQLQVQVQPSPLNTGVSKGKLFGMLALLFFVFSLGRLNAQSGTGSISGSVADSTGAPVIGAAVAIKGTHTGAAADVNGNFILTNIADGNYVLEVSMIGFNKRELNVAVVNGSSEKINITLKEGTQLDEVIVTGVFDKRTMLNSSIAITTLDSKILERQQPNSAADLLKNVSGVYVNSSLGEIRNVVYSRGVSANSADASAGYYYVSMQEDGLPVTNVTYVNYGPDYFLRSDANIEKVEALRGGSSSILGPNAPGGIFNYISKSGGDKFAGEVRLKTGIQGNGNPYYRADLNFGNSFGKDKSWSYNVGGFYRYDMGSRNPGYAMNKGGQVKGNIIKKYKTGSLKLYGKYLNDHNSWFEFSPAQNFDNPQYADGVKNTDTYLPNKNFKFKYPENSANYDKDFDVTGLAHSKEMTAGLDWNQELGKGWSINNNIKYSGKTANWNTGAVITPVGLNSIFPYLFSNTFNPGGGGTYNFTDITTGQLLAQVTSSTGFDHTVTNAAALPGQNIQPNSLMLQGLFLNKNQVNEVIDQFVVRKKLKNMSFTAGGYFASSDVKVSTGLVGAGYGTIENRPHPIAITLTKADGTVFQVTDPNGTAGLGRAGFAVNNIVQSQLAGFFAHNWQITEKLNLDWGVRVDNMHVKGTNFLSEAGVGSTTGGIDANPLTIYDNYSTSTGKALKYDKTLSFVSYSGALNYKFSNHYALYARFSQGKKAPDLAYYIAATTEFAVADLNPTAQDLKQAEIGFKMNNQKNLRLNITPFYSLLSNIATRVLAQNVDGTYYNTPSVLNSMETYGVEFEANWTITKNFSVRAVTTVQKATAKEWKIWVTGANGPGDDVTQDFSGKKADNNPNVMITLAPTYSYGKFYAVLNYKYMGARPANVPNTFTLPGFSQFDLNMGYDFTKKLSVSASINNILNGKGVMGWQAPGGFPASLDRQGFTPAQLAANQNQTFSILTIQPRSYFLTLAYKF